MGIKSKRAFFATALLFGIVISVFMSGCERDYITRRERQLEAKMTSPEMPVEDIGYLALDLAETFDEAGNKEKALFYYRRAVWAFEMHRQLSGSSHPLLDDAREGVTRIIDQQESARDLEIINNN